MRDRPHLTVLVDKLSALFLRTYRRRVTKTPAIDRLAQEGDRQSRFRPLP